MANYYYDLPDDILEMIETQAKKMETVERRRELMKLIVELKTWSIKKLVEYLNKNNLKKSHQGCGNKSVKCEIVWEHMTGINPRMNAWYIFGTSFFESGNRAYGNQFFYSTIEKGFETFIASGQSQQELLWTSPV